MALAQKQLLFWRKRNCELEMWLLCNKLCCCTPSLSRSAARCLLWYAFSTESIFIPTRRQLWLIKELPSRLEGRLDCLRFVDDGK